MRRGPYNPGEREDHRDGIQIAICVGGITAILMVTFALALSQAFSQTHSHPPQDAETHARFYSTWQMPNGGAPRFNSCCNQKDCYPTSMRRVGDTWFAKRREDGKWIAIPDSKLEQRQPDFRESPDGRSHVCMPPPGQSDGVYCATLGTEG